MKKIYVSLLHYNAYQSLILSIIALKKLKVPEGFSLSIVVVDNLSDEKKLKKIRKKFPEVTFLPQKENFGATKGFNIGYRFGISHDAQYLVMLSPDLRMREDAIEKLVKTMEKDKTIGIASCKMLTFTKPPKIFFVQGLLDKKLKTTIHVGIGEIDKGQYDEADENDFLNCPMLIRANVFKKVGYFEEKLFMYYEDIDWHTRIKKAGFRLTCVKDAIAWNLQPDRDSKLRFKKEYYLARNHLWFIHRHFSFRDQFIAYIYVLKNMLTLFLTTKKYDHLRRKYILMGYLDFLINRMGKKDFGILE
ncbi:MAG TPA: glycosyltransferase family 2 protein [Candidatus Eisenbacteria bacterium]|nr:glycosyltransferase family 2 protein [Candidatus Eisenbacteria bacterium]